jgi:ABC-2 type transport system ATP-binding protein
MAKILAKELTITFGQTVALDKVDLDIEENEIVGIFGRDGSGKTTLLSLLAALKYPSSGTITVGGNNPFENSSVTTDICFTWADQQIRKRGTVAKTLDFCGKLRPNWDMAYAHSLMVTFGLLPEMKIKDLKDDQRAILNLINGLASRTMITIFDDTYTSLSSEQRGLFFNEIRKDYRLNPRTIILGSESPHEVVDLLQDVIFLDRGRVIAHASAANIIKSAKEIMKVTKKPTLDEILLYFTKDEDDNE